MNQGPELLGTPSAATNNLTQENNRPTSEKLTKHKVRKRCDLWATFFTARRSNAGAVLGVVILSVRLSVRPSVTRMLCD